MNRLHTQAMVRLGEAILKARTIIQGYPDNQLSVEEYQAFYTCVLDLCGPTNTEFPEAKFVVYNKFIIGLKESIEFTVLPSLSNKRDVSFVREFDVMWSNYKTMGACLCKVFGYLDLLSEFHDPLETLVQNYFRYMVMEKLFPVLEEAVKQMVTKEREGYETDRELLNSVFKKMEAPEYAQYYGRLESSILSDLLAYYARLAPQWLSDWSAIQFVKEACTGLKIEKERASYYMSPRALANLEQVFRVGLFDQNELIAKVEVERNTIVGVYEEFFTSARIIPTYAFASESKELLALIVEICIQS